MRKGEEVELYESKIGDTIYMPLIASRKRRNTIGPGDLSLSYHAWMLIRNCKAAKFWDSNIKN